jgi:23S rRNA (cytosine1962-C5)-methyltransferase
MTASTRDALRDPLRQRILYESASVLVVHKPAGLAVDAPERADDLARMVRRRSPAGAYVGVVHRLERDVSGPCVLSLDRTHNARLAPPLERRTARRTLVAALAPSLGESALRRIVSSLKLLHKGARGSIFEFDPKADKLQAIAERLGPALLAPLHVSALEVATSERENTVVRAELPWALRDAVEERSSALDDGPSLVSRLRAGLWRRALVLDDDERTDLVRLANEGGDDVPGLAVDRYGDFAVAHVYASPIDAATKERVFSAVAEAFGARGVYAKFRPKQANTLVDTRRDDVAPSSPVWGSPTEQPTLVVREHGVRYVTRLGDGLSTGIFVDQRENRRWVREQSSGRSALNLFGYTGAFSVAAAVGGATRSLSIDAARTATAWLREHLAANESTVADRAVHEGVCAEVFGWLDGAKARKDRFDLVICDPPSYSFAKDGPRWTSERDWPALAASVFAVCAPGALALLCSNHRGISPAKFEAMVLDGARRAGVSIAAIESVAVCDDHPAARGEHGHLKTLRLRLR